MKVAFFNTKPHDRKSFDEAHERMATPHPLSLHYVEAPLEERTAVLADGMEAVCAFVNDTLDAATLKRLATGGTRLVALRCAGFNHVDLAAARDHGLAVVRVPAYSPHAVAEHTIALLLALSRKVHRAYHRVREGNFALEGLLGFNIHGLTVGVIGTGKIGKIVVRILAGFGCRVLLSDPWPDAECESLGGRYVPLEELLAESDVVSLHCPLTPESHHLIDDAAISRMKDGVILLNTSRGALVDSKAVIRGLKQGKIGHVGLDVYEEEGDLFFEDLSDRVIQDDVFARLTTFHNVVITGHQAFFTAEALRNIADTTLENVREFAETGGCRNQVSVEKLAK